MATQARAPVRPERERLFYGGMGLLILLLVFAGFAPTYYLRGAIDAGRPLSPMTPLIHLHGAVFTAWLALFIAQTALISTRRVAVHRRLGGLAMGLAAAMVVVGVLTAVQQVVRASGPPGIPPLTWFAVPLIDMPVFAGLVILGYLNRRDAQTHKRYMLIATILMLQPGIGRLPIPETPVGPELLTLIAFLGVLPLWLWDLAQRGRIHKATAIGTAVLAGEQLFRMAVWRTEAWQSFAGWVVGALS
jgi:hypothetical protein